MRFNKSNLKTIRADIATALASVESKHGVKFSLGNIRYSDSDFRCKLECFSSATGDTTDIDRQKFESKSWMVGVKKTAFGETFTSQGRKFTITGINTRAKKYPIQAETARGRRYKFSVTALPSHLRS